MPLTSDSSSESSERNPNREKKRNKKLRKKCRPSGANVVDFHLNKGNLGYGQTLKLAQAVSLCSADQLIHSFDELACHGIRPPPDGVSSHSSNSSIPRNETDDLPFKIGSGEFSFI
jgi:hypothetical protein